MDVLAPMWGYPQCHAGCTTHRIHVWRTEVYFFQPVYVNKLFNCAIVDVDCWRLTSVRTRTVTDDWSQNHRFSFKNVRVYMYECSYVYALCFIPYSMQCFCKWCKSTGVVWLPATCTCMHIASCACTLLLVDLLMKELCCTKRRVLATASDLCFLWLSYAIFACIYFLACIFNMCCVW